MTPGTSIFRMGFGAISAGEARVPILKLTWGFVCVFRENYKNMPSLGFSNFPTGLT